MHLVNVQLKNALPYSALLSFNWNTFWKRKTPRLAWLKCALRFQWGNKLCASAKEMSDPLGKSSLNGAFVDNVKLLLISWVSIMPAFCGIPRELFFLNFRVVTFSFNVSWCSHSVSLSLGLTSMVCGACFEAFFVFSVYFFCTVKSFLKKEEVLANHVHICLITPPQTLSLFSEIYLISCYIHSEPFVAMIEMVMPSQLMESFLIELGYGLRFYVLLETKKVNGASANDVS